MRKGTKLIVLAVLAVALAALASGCSSSSDDTAQGADENAALDPANTRYSASEIDGKTVANLKPAWSVPIPGGAEGVGYIGSPVVADGVAYMQAPDSSVQAVEIATGEPLWEKQWDSPVIGPNAVIVADGRVFGATKSKAFALDSESGEEVWSVPLTRNKNEKIAMTPGYSDGRVYFSTAPSSSKGDEVGVLWALEADSGEKAWHFDTVPESLWGDPKTNFGGGTTDRPAFDGEGSVYIGVGNPGPAPGTEKDPWGSSRPGPNLYTNSIVKLDEETGKVDWHYQVTPHSVYNWDVGGPVIAEAKGRKLVLAAGLSGIVVALDQKTGKPVWTRPVGTHNGHDDDGSIAMRGEYGRLKLPMTVLPGAYGGVAGPIAVDGSTVFLPVMDQSATQVTQEESQPSEEVESKLVALDLATGAEKWSKSLTGPVYGPATATNDLVFAVTFEGEMAAYDAGTGKVVWTQSLGNASEGGLAVSDGNLLVRTGFPASEGALPELVALELGKKKEKK